MSKAQLIIAFLEYCNKKEITLCEWRDTDHHHALDGDKEFCLIADFVRQDDD